MFLLCKRVRLSCGCNKLMMMMMMMCAMRRQWKTSAISAVPVSTTVPTSTVVPPSCFAAARGGRTMLREASFDCGSPDQSLYRQYWPTTFQSKVPILRPRPLGLRKAADPTHFYCHVWSSAQLSLSHKRV